MYTCGWLTWMYGKNQHNLHLWGKTQKPCFLLTISSPLAFWYFILLVFCIEASIRMKPWWMRVGCHSLSPGQFAWRLVYRSVLWKTWYHIQLTRSVLVPSNYVSTVIQTSVLKKATPKVNENGVWGRSDRSYWNRQQKKPQVPVVYSCVCDHCASYSKTKN